MISHGSVLLVDDEETFRESTRRLLEREGYDCVSVRDGDSALESLAQRRFDVMIADIRMPGNLEMRAVRRAREIDPAMPILLITGYPSMDTAVRAVNLTVSAYLTKPVDFDDLLSRVRSAVAQGRRRHLLLSIRQRLQVCLDDVASAATQPASLSDQVPIALGTVRTLAACLSDALALGAESGAGWGNHLCELLDCPQQPIHRRAILETINVLKQTKKVFKSKLLADLRTKLEGLISAREDFGRTT